MKQFVRAIDKINESVGKFFGLWILILIAIVLYEVFMRYVLNSPTLWVHEISTFIFGIMWVLAGGYTLYKKGMVNMDAVTTRFSEKTRRGLTLPPLFLRSFSVWYWYGCPESVPGIRL
jgi:TRAP-type mannitol/chloroaromatic compound transport system permease small subunit